MAWPIAAIGCCVSVESVEQSLLVLVTGMGLAWLVALVRLRRIRVQLAVERSKNKELSALRSALDQIDVAVALVGADNHAQFLNRAYRRIFRVSDDMAARHPHLSELLEHKFDLKVYETGTDRDTYIRQRLALIEAGDTHPLDLRLSNGEVMRFRCKVLADGGRMLNYGNVSDLVHLADELERLAVTDSLSGAFNRRYFSTKLEEEFDRSRQCRSPLSLLMVDFDAFKTVNDRLGHEAGDRVIRRFAEICSSLKGGADIFARLGGEEFALLLPHADLSAACRLAERIRRAIATERWLQYPGLGKVTVSIGAAEASNAASVDAFCKAADQALYAAKHGGRNRVAIVDRSRSISAA